MKDPMPTAACQACGQTKMCVDYDGFGTMICQSCIDDHNSDVASEQRETISRGSNA